MFRSVDPVSIEAEFLRQVENPAAKRRVHKGVGLVQVCFFLKKIKVNVRNNLHLWESIFSTWQWCKQPALLDLLLVGEVLDDAELVVVLRLVEGDVFVKVERIWAVRVAVVLNYSSVCYKIKRQKSNCLCLVSHVVGHHVHHHPNVPEN